MTFERYDDLDNPPDYTVLRDDYWELYDVYSNLLIQLKIIKQQLQKSEIPFYDACRVVDEVLLKT